MSPLLVRGKRQVRIEKYNFLATIKAVRFQLDLSQEELARKLGVSFATVNRWENGRFFLPGWP